MRVLLEAADGLEELLPCVHMVELFPLLTEGHHLALLHLRDEGPDGAEEDEREVDDGEDRPVSGQRLHRPLQEGHHHDTGDGPNGCHGVPAPVMFPRVRRESNDANDAGNSRHNPVEDALDERQLCLNHCERVKRVIGALDAAQREGPGVLSALLKVKVYFAGDVVDANKGAVGEGLASHQAQLAEGHGHGEHGGHLRGRGHAAAASRHRADKLAHHSRGVQHRGVQHGRLRRGERPQELARRALQSGHARPHALRLEFGRDPAHGLLR
mmetsp:Transcript_33801/g.97134  ORF Transcript_33801/g.97134 Transcript_33801/m.97134 type:complete len:269 (+) Transcript_33801:1425-2231(+)